MSVEMSTSSSAERARRSSDVDRPRAAQSNPHVARTSEMPCSRSASSKRRVTAARACCGSVIVGGGGISAGHSTARAARSCTCRAVPLVSSPLLETIAQLMACPPMRHRSLQPPLELRVERVVGSGRDEREVRNARAARSCVSGGIVQTHSSTSAIAGAGAGAATVPSFGSDASRRALRTDPSSVSSNLGRMS